MASTTAIISASSTEPEVLDLTPTSFTCFPRLPTELRLKIWKQCLKNHNPSKIVIFHVRCAPIPAILHTCKEARDEGCKSIQAHHAVSHSRPVTMTNFNAHIHTGYYANHKTDMLVYLPCDLSGYCSDFLNHCIEAKVRHIGISAVTWNRMVIQALGSIRSRTFIDRHNNNSELTKEAVHDAVYIHSFGRLLCLGTLKSITVLHSDIWADYGGMAEYHHEYKLATSLKIQCARFVSLLNKMGAELGVKWEGKIFCKDIQLLGAGEPAYEHAVEHSITNSRDILLDFSP